MQKAAIQLGVVIGIVTILLQPAVLTPIISFFFLGIIPGTTIIIPFWTMGLFYILLALALVTYLTYQPLYIGDMKHQEKVARQLARQKVMKQVAARDQVRTDEQAKEAHYQTATSTTKA